MLGVKDHRVEDLDALHKAYRSGKLRFLIGAGVSIQAGFPSWDDLNVSLLHQYLVEKTEDLSERDRSELARKLFYVLGRDGAAEFVRQMVDSALFDEFLGSALYGPILQEGQALTEVFPTTIVQRQLACMSRVQSYYTTNFDPALEWAIAAVRDG